MTQALRLADGGRIDRDRPLSFSFNGHRYRGFAGDTLASALLANGVHFVGRSFKYHRPRGIMSAGPEECNALVQVGVDPRTDPNTKATQLELVEHLPAMPQNCWPSLDFDIGAVNGALSRFLPSGFYYKTFMWPASFWMKYEYFVRHSAGLGRSPATRDPDRYDKTFAHCDVLVVGAGPAGLAAAGLGQGEPDVDRRTHVVLVVLDLGLRQGGTAGDAPVDGLLRLVDEVTGEEELDRLMDEAIELIAKAQLSDGYLSSWVQLRGVDRWADLHNHDIGFGPPLERGGEGQATPIWRDRR